MNLPQVLPQHRYISTVTAQVIVALSVLAIGLLPPLVAIVAGLSDSGLLVATHAITTSLLAFLLGWQSAKAAFLVLLIILPWQPLFSMPLAEGLGSAGIKMLVATKDIYIAVLLPTLYLKNSKRIKWNFADMATLPFLLIYILYMVISPAGLFIALVSFREGFTIIAFYLVGRLGRLGYPEVKWLLKAMLIIAIFVALFGYIERFFFDELTWTNLGVGAYMEAKQGTLRSRFDVVGEIPKNWFSRVNGNLVRRMVSGIGDPTSLSRYLSLPILTLLFLPEMFHPSKENKVARFAIFCFLTGALILTFGRGGLLIVIGGIILWSVFNRPKLALMIVPILASIFFVAPLFDFNSGSIPGHIESATNGIRQLFVTPLGLGLGTAGQKALSFSSNAITGTGESYVAALAFQTGILGVATYSLFIAAVSLVLFKRYRQAKRLQDKTGRQLAMLGLSVILGIYITSAFANSAIAPISAGPSLLYCGAFLTAYLQGK